MKEKSLLEEEIQARMKKERYEEEAQKAPKQNKWNLFFLILLLVSTILGLIFSLFH